MATYSISDLNWVEVDGVAFGYLRNDDKVIAFDGETIIGTWDRQRKIFYPNSTYATYMKTGSPTGNTTQATADYTKTVVFPPGAAPVAESANDEDGFTYDFDPNADTDADITPAPTMPIAGYTGAIPISGSGVGFGDPRTGHSHAGVDLFAPKGTPAVAIYGGTVVKVGYASDGSIGGNRVTIEDQWGNRYYYAHLDSIAVQVGQTVTQGQTLGGVGDTGNAEGTGDHLHFSYYPRGGSAVDPHDLLVGALTEVGTGNPAERYGDQTYSTADMSASNESIDDIFQELLGRNATAGEKSMIIGGNWSSDHVFRYIKTLPEWKGSPGYDALKVNVEDIWNTVIGGRTVPEKLLEEWINNDLSDLQIADRIRALPEYKDGREYQSTELTLTDAYETIMGRPMTETVQLALERAIDENWTEIMWEDFIRDQPEYETGIEMEGKKAFVKEILVEKWGQGAVDDLLADDPDYIKNVVWEELGEGADSRTIEQWAQKQPQWEAGPGASQTRQGIREYWGSIMRTPIDEEDLDEYVRDGLNGAQLLDIMRETDEYKARYAAKPAWLTEEEFNDRVMAFNSKGKVYFGSDDFEYSDEQLTYFFDHGITSDDLGDRYRWIEEGAAQVGGAVGTWSYYLEAMGVNLTQDMAYQIASGAQGSGSLMALITQGANRRTFDTAFALYMGYAPGPADYQYLETNFVSAEEYAKRMAAYENAVQNFPVVNEIFQRVYGYEADLQKLQDVALGAAGSGAYLALITAAEELDRYTLPWREYARTDPTPQQYSEWAGFAGPSELAKLLNARELVQANGREIMEIYNAYWVAQGAPPISDEDIFILEGQYQGWGAIDARLSMAAEHRSRQDSARSQWLGSPTAQAYTTGTQFGGPQIPYMRRPQG
jgi:murein DD-endopeptidase MepM/ murein hydrolase activator NlpD